MATRFYAAAGRIIMSKPGFNAAPGLADDRKLFDSDWGFGYVLIKSGSVNRSGSTINITFPTQHFRPLVEVTLIDRNDGYDYDRGTICERADTTSSHSVSVGSNISRGDYIVWGLSL